MPGRAALAGWAALLIGAASARQAAISGFRGPYTIPARPPPPRGVRKENTMRHHRERAWLAAPAGSASTVTRCAAGRTGSRP